MNRYVDRGLPQDAYDGRKVLVIQPSNDLARTQFDRLCGEADNLELGVWIEQISKSHGSWSIKFKDTPDGSPGGRVSIRALTPFNKAGFGRGYSADIIFVEDHCYPHMDYVEILAPIVAPGGEMFRA